MIEPIYIPAVVKMARTKISATRGRQRKDLDALIAAAETADAAMMARYPDSSDPVWFELFEKANAAGLALSAFAGPIVPAGED